jgi:adenine-specific DNA-methyltransferase
MNTSFENAHRIVSGLADDFRVHEQKYLSPEYNEAEARKGFIDKFWKALGWDVDHDIQKNPYEQEVKVERGQEQAGARKRADYTFFVAPNYRDVRFFVEAKKPSVHFGNAQDYFQTIRYGWNSQNPIAVLTDFDQFHILDCRYKPSVETAANRVVPEGKFHYSDYLDAEKFARIYWLFSREAVGSDSLEKFAAALPKPRGKAVQRGLFKGAYQRIDDSFLEELDEIRADLARAFKKTNPKLQSEELTEITQRTIDRLVFIRFLEDRLIEDDYLVSKFGDRGTAWEDFISASKRLNDVYNGIVFKYHALLDEHSFAPDEDTFANICEDLSHINSPYDFNAIPIHILGSIYERFLGKVIIATAKQARVEEKSEVRKAGGVYYTPEYIVRYIVDHTVGELIKNKTPADVAKMHFADIACGSGSFLLGVYDLLLRWHTTYYNLHPTTAKKEDLIERVDGLHLTLRKRREILLNNIYGVDIDTQAVEVAQLSLYLKLLQEETAATRYFYQTEFHETLLPPLNKNIICGNSLVASDATDGEFDFGGGEIRRLNTMDFGQAFPQAAKAGGFDAIVGNPPYGMLQPHNTSKDVLRYFRDSYVAADFKLEFFHLFLQRAVTLLKNEGCLGYIIPTTLLNNVYAQTLRLWLIQNAKLQQIAVALGRVFRDADVHPFVLILKRTGDASKLRNHEVMTTTELSETFTKAPHFESSTLQKTFSELPGAVWNILVNKTNTSLIKRLTNDFTPLKQVAALNRGLITGDRDKYFATHKKSKSYVPIITGSDVQRYFVNRPSEFVLFIRPDSAGGSWDEEVHFAPHKLVVRQICEEPTAAILTKPIAVTGNIFTVRAESVEEELFLLAVINSKLSAFFWRTMFTDFKSSFPQVTIFSLGQLPIQIVKGKGDDAVKKQRVVSLVERLLDTKWQLAKATLEKDVNFYERSSSTLERQIDTLIYQLYGMTDKEIALIES